MTQPSRRKLIRMSLLGGAAMSYPMHGILDKFRLHVIFFFF
jgi:hypothetical protein